MGQNDVSIIKKILYNNEIPSLRNSEKKKTNKCFLSIVTMNYFYIVGSTFNGAIIR